MRCQQNRRSSSSRRQLQSLVTDVQNDDDYFGRRPADVCPARTFSPLMFEGLGHFPRTNVFTFTFNLYDHLKFSKTAADLLSTILR